MHPNETKDLLVEALALIEKGRQIQKAISAIAADLGRIHGGPKRFQMGGTIISLTHRPRAYRADREWGFSVEQDLEVID